MNGVKEAKQLAATIVQDAVDIRINELKQTKAYQDLKEQLDAFENDLYHRDNMFYFDESGYLNVSIELDLSELEERDIEVLEGLLDSIGDLFYFHQDQYSQGYWQWTASQCLGETTIFNESPNRGHYAIYSDELGLKINSVLNEDHGFALIEQAMRKHGVYDSIVSTDYHGCFVSFLSVPENIRELSDDALSKLIDDIENEKEN